MATANRLLQVSGSTSAAVAAFSDCTPAFFVGLIERMFGTSFDAGAALVDKNMDGAARGPARTCQVAIEFLADEVVGVDLGHITGSGIAGGDAFGIVCLLELLSEIQRSAAGTFQQQDDSRGHARVETLWSSDSEADSLDAPSANAAGCAGQVPHTRGAGAGAGAGAVGHHHHHHHHREEEGDDALDDELHDELDLQERIREMIARVSVEPGSESSDDCGAGGAGGGAGGTRGHARADTRARVISPPTTELLTAHNRAWAQHAHAHGTGGQESLPPRMTTQHVAQLHPGVSPPTTSTASLSHTDSLLNQAQDQAQNQPSSKPGVGRGWQELQRTPQNSGLRRQVMERILQHDQNHDHSAAAHPTHPTGAATPPAPPHVDTPRPDSRHTPVDTPAAATDATPTPKAVASAAINTAKQRGRTAPAGEAWGGSRGTRAAGRADPGVPNFEEAFPSMPVDAHARRHLWSKYVKHAQTVIRNKAGAASPHRLKRKDAHLLGKHHQAAVRLDGLKQEAARVERMRGQDAARERAGRVKRAVYERRRSAAQLRQFYSKLHTAQKSKQLQHRTTEELAVRHLFEDYLKEAKDNALFMKRYAKEQLRSEQRTRDDALASLWNRFADQIELLEADVHQHRDTAGMVSKAKRREFDSYHKGLSQKMRTEIEGMQEQIIDEFVYSGLGRLRDGDFAMQKLHVS